MIYRQLTRWEGNTCPRVASRSNGVVNTSRMQPMLSSHGFFARTSMWLHSASSTPSSYPHSPGQRPYFLDSRQRHGVDNKDRSRHENIYTLPNVLSAARLCMAPACGYWILQGHYTSAMALFCVAGITDLVDGWWARQFHQKTVLGSILDPVADKTLMTCLTVSLASQQLVPQPLAILILSRDVAMLLGGVWIRYQSLPNPKTWSRYVDASLPTVRVRPTLISKYNTALQLVLMATALATPLLVGASPDGWMANAPITLAQFQAFQCGLQYVVACTTILSGLSYLGNPDAIRYLGRARKLRHLRKGTSAGSSQ